MSKAAIDYSPREDRLGKIVFMVRSGGYVMCKRPRCAPFVLSEKEWARIPKLGDPAAAEYTKAIRSLAAQPSAEGGEHG